MCNVFIIGIETESASYKNYSCYTRSVWVPLCSRKMRLLEGCLYVKCMNWLMHNSGNVFTITISCVPVCWGNWPKNITVLVSSTVISRSHQWCLRVLSGFLGHAADIFSVGSWDCVQYTIVLSCPLTVTGWQYYLLVQQHGVWEKEGAWICASRTY